MFSGVKEFIQELKVEDIQEPTVSKEELQRIKQEQALKNNERVSKIIISKNNKSKRS